MEKHKLLCVLFVEDSEDDMELMLATLHQYYTEIFHQRVDTETALSLALEQARWDLILCDHNLPHLDAQTALQLVKQKHADVPFVIVSGSMQEDEAVTAMLEGANDTVSKNNLARLLPVVEREMQKNSALHSLKLTSEQLKHMAYYDTLTGFPNREYLSRKVDKLANTAVPVNDFALVVVNIDRFLHVLHSLGLEAANEVLCVVGQRLRDCVGEHDFLARLGGDRFAVLCSGARHDEVLLAKLARVQEKIAEELIIAGRELFLSCSMGVCFHPQAGKNFQELFVNAEIAMNCARAEGGGRYQIFDPGMKVASDEQLLLEHALHRAIRQHEFFLHYQPQFDLLDGRMTGVEALLRWRMPDGTLVSPARFIPLLEETRRIVPVGEWVLRTACQQNKAWQDAGFPPVRVAVNLSSIQFQQPDLVDMIRCVLQETGLDPVWLELEVTENIALHKEERIIAILSELRAMNVSLAIDDFGTGYSSLSYLKRFPVQKLKIDRSFVSDIVGDEDGGSMVLGIVSLAHSLGLQVIAEGVETPAQASYLRAYGCNEVQGYLYGRPVLPGEIEHYWQPAQVGAGA